MHLPDARGGNCCGLRVLPVKPGNYVLGSPQSRAAARAVLERRLAGRKRTELILVSSIPRPRGAGICIGDWTEGGDGALRPVNIVLPGSVH